MNPQDALLAVWIIGVTQVLGLSAAVATRRIAGSRLEPLCQAIYFCLLGIMGVLTMGAFFVGHGCWLLSATTLAIMILLATYDCGAEHEVTVQ